MKRILVTGASGHLGRRLVSDLIKNNYKVTATSSDTKRLSSLRSICDEDRLDLIPCNLIDEGEVTNLIKKINRVDVLVHLANVLSAEPSSHKIYTDLVFMSLNLIGTVGHQIDHAIVGSCNSVYGDVDVRILSESLPTLPGTYYGSSKLAIEKFWNLYSVNTGKPVTCLRFPRFNDNFAKKLTNSKPKDATIISDLSKEITFYLTKKSSGVFNIYPKNN